MRYRLSERRRAGLLIGLSAATLFLLSRHLRMPTYMPHRTQWERALARRYGTGIATQYANHAEQLFHNLCAGFPRPRHPVLNYHVTYQILPALAIYRTLCEELDDPYTARDIAEQLVWEELRPTYRVATAPLTYLPAPFPLWQALVHMAMKTVFPPAGWRTRPANNTAQGYGFDIVGCVYFDTLRALGAPELTSIFCQMDDRLAQLIPSSIAWRRAGTLARGQAQCDFRWIDLRENGDV